jgi:hypothetical protein
MGSLGGEVAAEADDESNPSGLGAADFPLDPNHPISRFVRLGFD